MPDIRIAAEFLGSNGVERVEKCRQFGAEAGALAADAINPELRNAYLDLRRQWLELADEIEKLEIGWAKTGDI
jgi:hypothetical protein